MTETENETSHQLLMFGRELRRIADNFDEEVRAGRRRSSCFGAIMYMTNLTTSVDRITEILRRVFGLLDVRRLSVIHVKRLLSAVRRQTDMSIN